MVCRSFWVHLFDLTIAVGSVLAVHSTAAQPATLQVNQLLQDPYPMLQENQDYGDEEAQSQQQQAELNQGCYIAGNAQACAALQALNRHRSQMIVHVA